MGAGAVIKINYEYPSFGYALGASALGGTELFSDVIEPIKKAKAFGRTIKTELQKISTQMDIGSTIEHLIDQSSESAKAKSEISESANSARTDQEVVYGALTNVTEKLTTFGETVVEVDRKAASLIRERKLEFNRRYPHLESETEYRQRMDDRSGWEKAKDFGYGLFHGGIIGGFDSLINGRERFIEHKEAIKQKIADFATKVGNWVKENWEAIVAAIVVVVAAIVCIATFGAGTVFLVASLAAFAYAVTDKIVAINNGGKGIVETLEANGFHHLAQICKGFNWGLQITMLISGFKMSGAGFSIFKGSGFWATVGNGAVFGGGYNMAVDLTAYGINFGISKDAQSNPLEYLKTALKDTAKDTATGFVVGGTVAGISYTAIKGFSFFRSKFSSPNFELKAGDEFRIIDNGDGTYNVNGKTLSRNEVINPDTGEFKFKYGEMGYSSDNVYQKAYNLQSDPRRNIQLDAVKAQFEKNPDYFKQFGCNETTPSKIVKWFGDTKVNPNYVLHETINNKVQIVPRNLNSMVDHVGGNSVEKFTINAWNGYEEYISNGYHDRSSPFMSKSIDEMQQIYNQFSEGLQHENFTIDGFRGRETKSFLSDIFGYDIPKGGGVSK